MLKKLKVLNWRYLKNIISELSKLISGNAFYTNKYITLSNFAIVKRSGVLGMHGSVLRCTWGWSRIMPQTWWFTGPWKAHLLQGDKMCLACIIRKLRRDTFENNPNQLYHSGIRLEKRLVAEIVNVEMIAKKSFSLHDFVNLSGSL